MQVLDPNIHNLLTLTCSQPKLAQYAQSREHLTQTCMIVDWFELNIWMILHTVEVLVKYLHDCFPIFQSLLVKILPDRVLENNSK